MKKIAAHLVFTMACFCAFKINAQLAINTYYPSQADSVVQNIFFGPGVGSVSNVSFTGVPGALGSFTGTSNLGFSDGIILCTDNCNYIPNTASSQISGPNNALGDPQLQSIATNPVQDASVLEFDFAPATDTLKFSYVFASEEYPEYVCSYFNDVFGFFISGQNPAGGTYSNYNVALIPGSTLPVSINSVNPGIVGSSGGGTNCTGLNQSLSYSNLYVNNMGGTTVIFDGLTTVLQITIPVVVCDNYHIKLAVGNVGDGIFDSGVFLQSNTFGGGPPRIHSTGNVGVTAALDSTILCLGVTTQLTAAKSVSYSWSNGDTTQTTFVAQQNTVDFIVTNPANGCVAVSAQHKIVIDSTCFVGFNQHQINDQFVVSPNPFTDEILISAQDNFSKETIVTVVTLNGTEIKQIAIADLSKTKRISLKDLKPGFYFLKVVSDNGIVTKKIQRL